MKKLLSVLSILLLTACGTTSTLTDADLHKPIGKGQSRIIVSRDNSLLYGGAGATVAINGEEIATLGRGGESLKDVPAGHVAASVSTTGSSGSYSLGLEAKAGKTYRLLVSPNEAHSILPGTNTILFGVAGTVYDNMHESTGYFKLEEIK